MILRLLPAAFAAALASLPVTSPIAADRTLPRHDRPGDLSLARRKDPAPTDPPGEPAIVPTLGTLFNLHTDECVPLGDAEPSPDRFTDLLSDRALLARHDIAPPLLDVLRALARAHPGARIDLVSGYRSEKRNETMRKKGRHVASHSQHSLGQAVDFRVEGLTVGDIVKEVEAMKWRGGIGRYDAASDRFVHVDVGPNRRWKGQ